MLARHLSGDTSPALGSSARTHKPVGVARGRRGGAAAGQAVGPRAGPMPPCCRPPDCLCTSGRAILAGAGHRPARRRGARRRAAHRARLRHARPAALRARAPRGRPRAPLSRPPAAGAARGQPPARRPARRVRPALQRPLGRDGHTSSARAKGGVTREQIRTAVGQLFDYGRFVDAKTRTLLVPSCPPSCTDPSSSRNRPAVGVRGRRQQDGHDRQEPDERHPPTTEPQHRLPLRPPTRGQ